MKKLLSIIIVIVLLFSCKTQLIDQDRTYVPEDRTDNINKKHAKTGTFYFIRHCEVDGHRDTNPHLSNVGIDRANKYSSFFMDKNIDVVFTTNLNRTVDTAEIIAKKSKVDVLYYDPFNLNYKKFLEENKSFSVVIVGHSNTTPEFVNGLLGEPKYSQMVDKNYSDIFKLDLYKGQVVFDEVLTIENEIQKIEDAKLTPSELKKVLRERKKTNKK